MLKRKGFTLIELLIVIAIIAILAGIVLVSTTSATKKARDSARVSDIDALNTAITLYYSDTGNYPANLNALVPDYIERVPNDPQNNPYNYMVSGDEYILYICLETGANNPAWQKSLTGSIDVDDDGSADVTCGQGNSCNAAVACPASGGCYCKGLAD